MPVPFSSVTEIEQPMPMNSGRDALRDCANLIALDLLDGTPLPFFYAFRESLSADSARRFLRSGGVSPVMLCPMSKNGDAIRN